MLIFMYLRQVGKFYELYNMDATVGVKELGLIYMKVTNALMMVLNVGMTVNNIDDDGDDDDINDHGHLQLLQLIHMTNSNIIFVFLLNNINYLKMYNNNDNII